MEQKRDLLAALLAAICWPTLLAAEFFYLCGYLPWAFCWRFLLLTLLLLVFAVARRKLLRQKALLRITGLILAVLTFATASVCWTNALETFLDVWTKDISRYERVRGHPLLDQIAKKDERLNYFPYTIPDYAGGVKFYYMHTVMDEDHEIFSLEFIAPPEKVSEWEALFKEKAEYPGSYLDRGYDLDQMADWLGCPHEFRVYMIYAARGEAAENPPLEQMRDWKEGELHLGAVNLETNRVYFYETHWESRYK